MILLEVPPKLIIYKSDIFITICQCEKCICNELLHYAYTYYTSSYNLYNMNLENLQIGLPFVENEAQNRLFFNENFSFRKRGTIDFCKFLTSIKWIS